MSDIMPTPAAIILSCSGLILTEDERRLFASTNPLGFILFKRNCDMPEQIRALTKDLRACVGWDCPILIDQEGGRVQRLKPPLWQQHMPAQSCNTPEEAAGIAHYIANDLKPLGIDVNCAPCVDVLCEQTHDVIGDRAFSDNPDDIAEKGLAVCRAYIDEGITPVMKHIPGHGRAASDSHLELPIVDTPLDELDMTDFEPFRQLSNSDVAPQIWAMVAHVVYTALDESLPATISKPVIHAIRKTIGFDGFLIADDISMKALDKFGNLGQRAIKTLEAGCDATLYCDGKLNEMKEIMRVVPPMRVNSLNRYDRSRLRRRSAA
ncbi:MAG: glycoside hydrolase family 3 protein [Alphaproteobacteria bacterium]|nr:glycoside hydrolase family 3 protein [Alphaproteobacteria bacterium]NCQ89101.1 glycoside hydrolase family 3 protein [Alphaproteobacteria bacterium]NCT08001.1 glycoside hydrolase family 3 protein [Alphaproteobacteria bacterium]